VGASRPRSPPTARSRRAFNPTGEAPRPTGGGGGVTYGYSAAGQPASKAYADGSQTAFQHDPCGNVT
jgi:hypothetical protein